MEKGALMYEGKAKKVFAASDPEWLIVSYKDDATATATNSTTITGMFSDLTGSPSPARRPMGFLSRRSSLPTAISSSACSIILSSNPARTSRIRCFSDLSVRR